MAVLSKTVLPLPAAPRITRDSPSFASKERWDSSGESSNITVTSLNRRTGWRGLADGEEVSGIRSGLRDENLRDEIRENEDEHGSDHHRLRCGASDALSTAGGSQAVETADQRNHKSENQRLHQPLGHIVPFQGAPCRGPILPRLEAQKEMAHHPSGENPHEIR